MSLIGWVSTCFDECAEGEVGGAGRTCGDHN